MGNIFLDIKDLHVIYTQNKKTVRAINGISLSLEKGQTLGLVGETGAGKTTIAKSIMRILPDRAARITGGEIWLDGVNVLEATEEQMLEIRGKKVAMIFQDPMTALNPLATIGDQILEAIMLHEKCQKSEGMQKVGDLLEMVGIPRERYVEYPHQFSGGMKQRVVIAMALACDPELLLADEPTTALDVTVQAQVLKLIKDLQESRQMPMILITHDLGVVAENCDNVAVIYAGRIVEYGNKEEIFDHPSHPYTIGLFHSLPNMSIGEKRLHSIKGLPPDPTDLPKGCAFWPRCRYATEACKKEIPVQDLGGTHYCRCVKEKSELMRLKDDREPDENDSQEVC